MRKIVAFITLALLGLTSHGQETLVLDTCLEHAYQKLEFDKITNSYEESAELAEKNLSNNWYPKLVLDGNFTYQNENISIPMAIPGMDAPVAPLNINRLVVNISQTIYDGSVTANVKKVEEARYNSLKKQVDVDRAGVKAKVTQLFITINLMEANSLILEDKKTVVNEQLKVLEGAVNAGSVPEVNLKLLQAELMSLDQIILESKFNALAFRASLSEITGLQIASATKLIIPTTSVSYDDDVSQRAELQMLDLQMKSIDAQTSLTGTARMPKVSAFASLGAGNPGYDIFYEDIAPMAMVGLKLNWNIWDWNKTKNQKQSLTINRGIVQSKKVQASTQFLSELKAQQLEIEKYKMLLKQDENVVNLRKEITLVKAAELENGSITTTAYLDELNRENEAKLTLQVHQLKLVMAQLNYLIIQGK
jgi:outer membrane protein TolC